MEETKLINGKQYKLTFFDDFDGTSLDKSKWELCPEWNRGDIGGKWDDSMITLDGNSNLIVSSSLNENGTPISGAVRTRGLFEQARGYFEIRCKLQQAAGFWGAFWLMCDTVRLVGNGCVNGAEIDVFESFSVEKGAINFAIHWDGYREDHKCLSKSIYDTSLYDDNYHIFSCLITEDGYYFYIDGNELCRITSETYGYAGSCEVPLYLKISTEFGTWAGEYNAESLPSGLVVDYVKVYSQAE